MNNSNLIRREELCRNLNMNFDEASELFSEETLESMQMAKVNGGDPITIIAAVVTIVAGGIAIYQFLYKDGSVNTGTTDNIKMDGAVISIDGRTLVGYSVDTLSNGNIVYSYTFQPSPAPTEAIRPPLIGPTN